MCSRPVTILVALVWILSSLSILRPHIWPQRSRCLIHPCREKDCFLNLVATLLLMQPSTCLAFIATRTRCWLIFNLSFTSTCPPTSSTSKAGKSWAVHWETKSSFFLQYAGTVKLWEWRKGICRGFLCSTPFFGAHFCVLPGSLTGLQHMMWSLNLFSASEGGKTIVSWSK